MIKTAAWIATSIFILMALFQLLLALGAPLGKLAWGGKYRILPLKLRIGSFISSAIFMLATLIILENSGIYFTFNKPYTVGLFNWIFAGVFGLSTLGNMLSKSPFEKIVMTPTALILTVLCLVIAIGN